MFRTTMLALATLGVCGAIVVVLLFRETPLDVVQPLGIGEAAAAGGGEDDASTAADDAPGALREPVAEPARDRVTVEPLHRKGPYVPTTREILVTLVSALDGATLGTKVDLSARAVAADGTAESTGAHAMSAFPTVTRFDLPYGRWKFVASIAGIEVGSSVVDATPGTAPLELTITIDAAGPFAGTVVGPDGAIVSNASVHLRVVDPQGEATETAGFVASDTAGRFSMPALVWRPGTAIGLAAERDDFARSASVSIVGTDGATDKRPVLHLVQRLPEVVGRIVDSVGTPLAAVIVNVRSTSGANVRRRVETGDDGGFRLRGMLAGAYELGVERRCLEAGSLQFVVDAVAPRGDLGSIVTVAPTHAMKLRVVDSVRLPQPSVTVIADGIILGRTDREGRLTTALCSTEPVDLVLNVPRAGITATVRAGRFAPSDVEHELVAGYAGITLRLRDRADPDTAIQLASVSFVAARKKDEIRGSRIILDGLLVIQQPEMEGSWTIDVAVEGYAKTNVAVEVDAAANAPPIDVWLERSAE